MFPWFLYHFLWFLSCIFPCFCSHFLRFYNIFYAASQLFPIFSVVRTWLASPLLSVRLVTRATCILVIAIDNNRYESCQSNSRVIGCSIWRLSKTTQTYILWFSDFESKSLLLLNFWPPLSFLKKRGSECTLFKHLLPWNWNHKQNEPNYTIVWNTFGVHQLITQNYSN